MQAAFINTQGLDSSENLLAKIQVDQNPRPKETTAVGLAKSLRRIQSLQEKLKTGHFVHNCDEHTTE